MLIAPNIDPVAIRLGPVQVHWYGLMYVIGYVLFYNFSFYLANPLSIVRVWDGGMSFHGGLMGVLVALWWWGRTQNKHVFEVTDFIAPWVPIGLFAGRIGNFINQELWGRVTDVPWGMVFHGAGELPRHPSQLYQAGLEGVALLIILVLYSRKPRPYGAVSGMLGIFYGLFRFLVEFVREPDAQLGFVLGPFTMGQLLSLPMIVIGAGMIAWAYKRK